MALSAVSLIYQHLPQAYAHGADLVAREQMALASCYAGLAFTRANVGNVHAIAHQLGGLYHTPHGLANAIMLPPVLRYSSPAIQPKLAELARKAGLGHANESTAQLAQRFLDSVEAMNRALGIPKYLDSLKEADIPALAKAACWEADTNYPVPRSMSVADCEALLREVLAPAGAPSKAGAADKPKPSAKPDRRSARKRRAAPD
jgi:alcohol dehydrogenase class IV